MSLSSITPVAMRNRCDLYQKIVSIGKGHSNLSTTLATSLIALVARSLRSRRQVSFIQLLIMSNPVARHDNPGLFIVNFRIRTLNLIRLQSPPKEIGINEPVFIRLEKETICNLRRRASCFGRRCGETAVLH